MNAMKASIGQLKYRHIFKLMFSCCFLSELDAMFDLCCCNYRWKLSVHQARSQDSPATEFSNALVPGKKASKAGRSDCWFDFFIRKF